MYNKKIAFIGGGNMAYAIASRILDEKLVTKDDLIISDIDEKRLNYIRESLGVKVTNDSISAVENSDILIIAVKPNAYPKVSEKIKDNCIDKCIISIMAGQSKDKIAEQLHPSNRILRVMPNTPALVGEGMTIIAKDNALIDEEYVFAKSIFESLGKVCEIEEKHIDACTGISGSGPAYVYMFIEALADAGVLHGLPRDIAYQLAAQTLKGAATMVQDTNKHPGELKDDVTSPGGTTIEAVKSLEKNNFRYAVIECVDVCINKAKRI